MESGELVHRILQVLKIFKIKAVFVFLPGTGRISRKREHFEGLLKAIRDQNIGNFQTRVEKRDLSEYEEVM